MFRDEDGCMLTSAAWKREGGMHADMDKANAFYNTMTLAKDCCFQSVKLESDRNKLIRLVNGDEEVPGN